MATASASGLLRADDREALAHPGRFPRVVALRRDEDLQRLLVRGLRSGQIAAVALDAAQIPEQRGDLGRSSAARVALDLEGLFVEGTGLRVAALVVVDAGELRQGLRRSHAPGSVAPAPLQIRPQQP